MKIEFMMKWPIDLTPEEREEFRQDQLLRGDDEPMFMPKKYVYREVTMDIVREMNFNRAEEGHTAVRTENDYFILKIPYHHFKAIYEISTGDIIKSHKDFRFMEPGEEFGDEGYGEGDPL